MYQLNRTTISPSFSSLPTLSYSTNSTNRTVLQSISGQTNGTFSPSPTSAGTISFGKTSNDLFSIVFIASVAVATFLFLCLISVIFCCCGCCRRKRRTANVTEKKRHPRGIRHSLKRTFSDGPHYAVTNLNGNHYTGITEKRADEGQGTAQSSLKSNISRTKQGNNASEAGKIVTNDKSIYERYLSPIEGVPKAKAVSREQDSGYLEPVHGFPAPVKILRTKNTEQKVITENHTTKP